MLRSSIATVCVATLLVSAAGAAEYVTTPSGLAEATASTRQSSGGWRPAYAVRAVPRNGIAANVWGLAMTAEGRVWVADGFARRLVGVDAGGAVGHVGSGLGDRESEYGAPAGITLDGAGAIYAVDQVNDRVNRYDASGRFVGRWGTQGSGPGEFDSPWDVAVGEGGRVYVTDTGNHRVQIFSASGDFIRAFGVRGAEPGQFERPYGIAAASDGSVFVVDSRWLATDPNDRVQQFAADGRFIAAWGQPGREPGQFWGARGVAVSPDGEVLVTDNSRGRVQRFTVEGNYIGDLGTGMDVRMGPIEVGTDGSIVFVDATNRPWRLVNAQAEPLLPAVSRAGDVLSNPERVKFANNGNVFVLDHESRTIVEFTPDGRFIEVVADLSGYRNYLYGDFDVAADGSLYVTGDDDVYEIEPSGLVTVMAQWSGLSGPGRQAGGEVAVSGDTVYVGESLCEASGCERYIRAISRQGAPMYSFSVGPPLADAIWLSGEIEAGLDGTVIMADPVNHSVRRFTTAGVELAPLVAEGVLTGTASIGLAVDSAGNVFVGDAEGDRILVFAADGHLTQTLGGAGSDLGKLRRPVSLDASGDRIAVVEQDNRRVQIWAPEADPMWRAEWYSDLWMGGSPDDVSSEERIDFDWGLAGPPSVPGEGFSARFSKTVDLPPGAYEFQVKSSGPTRLWVGTTLVVETLSEEATSTRRSATVDGEASLLVEYRDEQGPSGIEVSWRLGKSAWLPIVRR